MDRKGGQTGGRMMSPAVPSVCRGISRSPHRCGIFPMGRRGNFGGRVKRCNACGLVKWSGNERGSDVFRQVQEAYSVLSDAGERREYDRNIIRARQRMPFGPAPYPKPEPLMPERRPVDFGEISLARSFQTYAPSGLTNALDAPVRGHSRANCRYPSPFRPV
jgi:hypothetical protein